MSETIDWHKNAMRRWMNSVNDNITRNTLKVKSILRPEGIKKDHKIPVKWNTRVRSASKNEANVLERAYHENGLKVPVRWNSGTKTARRYPMGIEPYVYGNSGWQTSREQASTIRDLQENRKKGILNAYESAYRPPGNYSLTERETIAKRASEDPEKFNRFKFIKNNQPPREVMMARLRALKHGPPPSRNAPLPPSPKKFNAFKLSPLAKLAKIAVSESPTGVRFLTLPKKTRRKTRRSKP